MRLLILAAFALLLAACDLPNEPLCIPGLSSPQSCAGMSDG